MSQERPGTGIKLTEDDEALLAKLGDPPMDPIGNAEWVNNSATVWLAIVQRNKKLDLGERVALVTECMDRVSRSVTKASQSKRIGDIQKKTGVRKKPAPDAASLVSVNGGGSLRAGSRIQRRGEESGSLSGISPKDDGPRADDGGRTVGQPGKDVH